MLSRLRALAIIPARAGSKRLPGKNWKLLGGKPLVTHTLEAAIACGCFDKIVVSTDSNEVAEASAEYHEIVIDPRPQHLAGDTITMREVALDLMERYERVGESYDLITVLLPTCPFRKSMEITQGLVLIESDPSVDAVISVSPYEFPPQKSLAVDAHDNLRPAWPDSPLLRNRTRSQDHPTMYHENGAFFICRWDAFRESQSYYSGNVKAFRTSSACLVDIDEGADFEYAQFLLESGRWRVNG